MYRNHITVAAIFIILVVLSYGFNGYIDHSTQVLQGHIDQLEKFINEQEWEEAQSTITAMQKDWESIRKWWSIGLENTYINGIELALKRTEKVISVNNRELSLIELTNLQVLVEDVVSDQILSLQNIF